MKARAVKGNSEKENKGEIIYGKDSRKIYCQGGTHRMQ